MVKAYILHTASQCKVHFSRTFDTTLGKCLNNISYAAISDSLPQESFLIHKVGKSLKDQSPECDDYKNEK